MTNDKVKAVLILTYIGLATVCAVLLIDIQIKNAILDAGRATQEGLDRLTRYMGEVNDGAMEETSTHRDADRPGRVSGNGARDDAGMEAATMGGENIRKINGSESAKTEGKTVPRKRSGNTRIPPRSEPMESP